MGKTAVIGLLLILTSEAFAFNALFDNTISDEPNYYDYSDEDSAATLPIEIPAKPLPPKPPLDEISVPDEQYSSPKDTDAGDTEYEPFIEENDNSDNEIKTPKITDVPIPTPAPRHEAPPKYSGRKSEVRRQCKTVNYHGYTSSRGLKGGDTAKTLGCDDHFTLGPNLNTAQMYIVSNEFRDFLRAHMIACTNVALKDSGIKGKATAVHIATAGTYSYRECKKNKLSIHASGRAIDIKQMKLFLDTGETYEYPMTKDLRFKNFYKDFSHCWRNKVRSTCPSAYWARNQHSDCGVINANSTSKNGRRTDHDDHVHIALPFCGRDIPGMCDY